MSLSENVTFDDENDVATIYGNRVGGSVLRAFCEPTPDGAWFRTVRLDDGTLITQMKREEAPSTEAE